MTIQAFISWLFTHTDKNNVRTPSSPAYSRLLFDRVSYPTLVSWNSIISGLARNRQNYDALNLFVGMRREGPPPTEFTLSSVITACAISESRQLHGLAFQLGMDSDVFAGTAVIDVYSKCNTISDASQVIDGMHEKSDATWSTMVSGYTQNGCHEDALMLLRRCQSAGIELTQFTLSAVLSACACLAANVDGTQLRAFVVRTGFDSDVYVATSLVYVYSRCGRVEEAYLIFLRTEEKNAALWIA